MSWYKKAQKQNTEKVYHGGYDIGDEPEISRGYQASQKDPSTGEYKRTGYDSGGVFFTPDLDYAKSYQKQETPGLYEAEISLDNIFDATDNSHWDRFKKALLQNEEYDTARDAMSDYNNIKRSVQESIRDGYPDWATISQWSELVEDAGFDGIKMLERPAGFMHDKPIPSYALFKNVKSKRHPEQGTFKNINEMPYFKSEENLL